MTTSRFFIASSCSYDHPPFSLEVPCSPSTMMTSSSRKGMVSPPFSKRRLAAFLLMLGRASSIGNFKISGSCCVFRKAYRCVLISICFKLGRSTKSFLLCFSIWTAVSWMVPSVSVCPVYNLGHTNSHKNLSISAYLTLVSSAFSSTVSPFCVSAVLLLTSSTKQFTSFVVLLKLSLTSSSS